MQCKVNNLWSNKSLDDVLGIMKQLIPRSDHHMPDLYYATSKILKDLGLGYERIYAFKNDCVLFYKENVGKEEPRYVISEHDPKRKIPNKVLHYFLPTA